VSINSIKEQIEAGLSVLIGQPIRYLRRADLMLGIDFGDNVPCKQKTEPKKGEVIMKPKFAIHIHCSWRILNDDCIYLGHGDLFGRILGHFRIHDDDADFDDVPFDPTSKDLNELFAAREVRVTLVEANDLGDFKIFLDDNYCLEVFVDATGNEESWRLLTMDDDSDHFIVFDEED